MKIHYIQHVPFEGLGNIENWIKQKNYSVSSSKLYENCSFPDIQAFDALIVMGGPMGIYDEDKYPWLVEEKSLIKQAIHANKKIIGICLGAQLIADALGAKVYKNPQREIGWFPLKLTDNSFFKGFHQEPVVFHWHGDTFDLPDGALPLGSTSACQNQGFIIGDKIIGMQFHLDTTIKSAEALIKNCGDEITDAPYIQSAEYILSQDKYFEGLENYLYKFLDQAS